MADCMFTKSCVAFDTEYVGLTGSAGLTFLFLARFSIAEHANKRKKRSAVAAPRRPPWPPTPRRPSPRTLLFVLRFVLSRCVPCGAACPSRMEPSLTTVSARLSGWLVPSSRSGSQQRRDANATPGCRKSRGAGDSCCAGGAGASGDAGEGCEVQEQEQEQEQERGSGQQEEEDEGQRGRPTMRGLLPGRARTST